MPITLEFHNQISAYPCCYYIQLHSRALHCSDRPVFCGCSFPPTALGSGGPFIYQTRLSIRWSHLESRIRGMFACRKDGQQLATMPWINAWYFYSHRRVDESIGVGSKLPGLQPQHKDLVCSCPGGISKELAAGLLLRNVGSHAVCLPCYIFDACFICVESFSTIVLLSAVEAQGKRTD